MLLVLPYQHVAADATADAERDAAAVVDPLSPSAAVVALLGLHPDQVGFLVLRGSEAIGTTTLHCL